MLRWTLHLSYANQITSRPFKMRSAVSVLLVVLGAAALCQGTTTDREDIADSKDSSLARFLQPLEARLRDDQTVPERRSRELSYFG